ncbi:MAG: DUF3160 domain-containing protein, partial [Candidatus Margulisiibacteriota bacterium]
MFEDQAQPNLKPASYHFNSSAPQKPDGNKTALVLLAALITALFIVAGIWLIFRKKAPVAPSAPEQATTSTPITQISTSTLPGGLADGAGIIVDGRRLTEEELKAENLAFAQFYKAEANDFKPKALETKLPLFAKTDLANYYDVSRKLDLDKSLDKINRDGFVLLDNQYAAEADDFYKIFELLAKKEIPQFISGDFLLYYYQNNLKETYKEIESNVFYQDVWTISKSFFDLANTRYKKRRDLVGAVNDPVLEAERLEAAFWAVSLELLKPQPKQINELNKSDAAKFSIKEAADFDFTTPDYLADEVAKETTLIARASGEEKSPIFLYQKNYSEFSVPPAYLANPKLRNFYLAANWLKSPFPLYYQSESCPDCALDKNDWLINFIAASLITRDFADNQELKNYWAKVYKILAFFQGIRKELTYLNYQEVLKSAYDEAYNPELIFSGPGGQPSFERAMAAAEKLADEIQKGYNFGSIVGGLDRADTRNLPKIGMRLLQENFWPNDYIGGKLTGASAGGYLGPYDRFHPEAGLPLSGCAVGREKKIERCTIIGLDVINLFKPLSAQDVYFTTNSNYRNYQAQSQEIKQALGKFNVYDWHENNYWTTLDIIKKNLLEANLKTLPTYVSPAAWQAKEVNTALGAWVNLGLPADSFGVGSFETGGFGERYKLSGYIEPNLVLVNELSANSKMLEQMFSALKLGANAGFTSKKLNELVEYLDKIKAIVKKELNQEPLDENDQLVLGELIRNTMVVKAGAKSLNLQFKNKSIKESIAGVKLLVVVVALPDKKILTVGPVFNYQEGR